MPKAKNQEAALPLQEEEAQTEMVPAAESLPATQSEASVAQLLQTAVERGTDPDALEKLVDLYERMDRRQAEKAYNEAFMRFQAECPVILHNAKGHVSTYSSFEYVVSTIRPYLNKHGLSFSFNVNPDAPEGMIRLNTIIRHAGGHQTEHIGAPFPSQPLNKGMTQHQGVGAGWSYAKRYGLLSALGIATRDDNDGRVETGELITDEQVANLEDMIEESGADRKRFLHQFMGVEQTAMILKSQYQKAFRALKRKMEESR